MSDLISKAVYVAERAATDAVTAMMAPRVKAAGLPVKDVLWYVARRPVLDGTDHLVGQVQSGVPDDEVRDIVAAYVTAWGGTVRETSHSDGQRTIIASGLVYDGIPVEVWGVLYGGGSNG